MGKLTLKQVCKIKQDILHNYYPYCMRYWSEFDYSVLSKVILSRKKAGRGDNGTYNDIIIMCDTETSKHHLIERIEFAPEYNDILNIVKLSKYKYNPAFKDVATKKELRSYGITFAKDDGYAIDSLYQKLQQTYSWIFDDVYNDIDALENIYWYLVRNKPLEETETCVPNHVVAWTISLRAWGTNIATLYGQSPVDFCECIERIQNELPGHETFFYWHNMSYDWVFIRKFMFQKFGHPDKQLNTKPYYPIYIKWSDAGITFRDSLILAQRRLEKWADDLYVTHKKAVGKWDYDRIRTQHEIFSADELTYIENDTLAGVECIDATMKTLKKRIYSMPYTATGIPREEARKIGKKNGARESFLSMVLSYNQYIQSTRCYHGGYTHANRHLVNKLILGVICRDFSSSYPYVMLSEKYPMEKFSEYDNCDLTEILEQSEDYAFMFKLILINPRLKDYNNPMPALQFSKCCIEDTRVINPVVDNGRILSADYVEIYLTEIDAQIIKSQYDTDGDVWPCTNVFVARKDYLPRWFTDYVYKLYADKCTLKNGDPVLYSIAKAKLNALYGMCVQKSIRENMVENYVTGEYKKEMPVDKETRKPMTDEQLYQKYVENNNSVLPYQWGVWVTCYAMRNLFILAGCCQAFVYSDTDSIYGKGWIKDKLDTYNNGCLEKLRANGYEPVEYKGQTFIPGVAEFDGAYSEFRVLGAKRYCCRYSNDVRNKEKNRGKLKITVAGVPKSGVSCLNDDINNFYEGFVFPGSDTGKLTHHYIISPEIYYDDMGNIVADSVDLTECDYELSSINKVNIDNSFYEEVVLQVYDE